LECSAISCERVISGGKKANEAKVLFFCVKNWPLKTGRNETLILLVEYSCCGVALCDDLVGFQARPLSWEYEL
jgi:hypothetical protein